MKNLYRKGKVHPSTPPPPTIAEPLALLPATILTLTVALSPEDKEVLAYLISCSNTSANFSVQKKTSHKTSTNVGVAGGDHYPMFQCNCFSCYMNYWSRWDTSPNRQLIHEIIDAYEDGLFQKKKSVRNKKGRRSRVNNMPENENCIREDSRREEFGKLEAVDVSCSVDGEVVGGDHCGDEGLEKGSMRKFVNYIGEKIWGVWSK